MFLNKLPIVRKYKDKLNKKFFALEKENLVLATQNVDLRLKIKKITGEKVNVVFVCHRPAVWTSLKTVYEALKADELFDVKIVTIPNKKQLPKLGLSHEVYESEGAEEFWKGDDVIAGYNYETNEWLDLRLLKADYICFQQPYDIERTDAYKSWVVSRYAKLFYVAYASNFIGDGVLESCTPRDFTDNVSFFFTQNNLDDTLVKNVLSSYGNSFTKVVKTGFPRFDGLDHYKDAGSELWNYANREKKFRLIWTPRWTTNEGNCGFFDYKDKLLSYCDTNQNVDFIFRPHPQAFLEWNSTGELPEAEAELYKAEYDRRTNAVIDYSKEYFKTFYSSDCLVTDVSSIVADYMLTGKPIVYCHKKDCFNDFSRRLAEGFYWVRNWQELETTLDMLRGGKDPLREKRNAIIKESFYLPAIGAGLLIKNVLKCDARGEQE